MISAAAVAGVAAAIALAALGVCLYKRRRA
jgi:hypothetical protein